MRKFFTGILLLLTFSFTAMPVALTYADDTNSSDVAKNSVCAALNDCNDQGAGVGSILKLVLNVLSVLIGFVAVVMIIYNGFRFVASGGEASKVASARSGIVYALIGVAIAALAQIMVHFVIHQVDSTPSAAYCKAHPKDARCKP